MNRLKRFYRWADDNLDSLYWVFVWGVTVWWIFWLMVDGALSR